MKVLFLDIDGVANCATTTVRHNKYIGIDPLMAFRIGKIQLDTGCEFVLSSAWRLFPDGRDEVEKRIAKMYDVTPRDGNGYRGEEVNRWLALHPEVTRYAIIDDASDFYDDQPLFQTEWKTGITEEIAKEITEYLNMGEDNGNNNSGKEDNKAVSKSEGSVPGTNEAPAGFTRGENGEYISPAAQESLARQKATSDDAKSA